MISDKVQYRADLEFTSNLEERLDAFEVKTSNKKILFPTDCTSTDSFLETGGETGYVWITLRSRYNSKVSVKKKFNVGMLHDSSVRLKNNRYPYTGKQIKPKVTVRFAGKVLKEGKDYKVSYSNNVKIGKGVVTVKGIGKYAGSGKKAFQIVAKK